MCYDLLRFNNKSETNKGYCFEKLIYLLEGRADEWKQDNKPSDFGGDINIDGIEYQIKFAPKESLATIFSTNRLLTQIDRMIKELQ